MVSPSPRPDIRALGPPLGAGMMRINHRQKEQLTTADGVAPFAHCSQCSQCIYWVYWERFIIISSHRTGIHWQRGDRSQCGGGPCTGNGWRVILVLVLDGGCSWSLTLIPLTHIVGEVWDKENGSWWMMVDVGWVSCQLCCKLPDWTPMSLSPYMGVQMGHWSRPGGVFIKQNRQLRVQGCSTVVQFVMDVMIIHELWYFLPIIFFFIDQQNQLVLNHTGTTNSVTIIGAIREVKRVFSISRFPLNINMTFNLITCFCDWHKVTLCYLWWGDASLFLSSFEL